MAFRDAPRNVQRRLKLGRYHAIDAGVAAPIVRIKGFVGHRLLILEIRYVDAAN